MPFFHTAHGLYAAGLVDNQVTRTSFWTVYQKVGLGTFVFVSGMAFVLSTHNGVRWNRLLRRSATLFALAMLITVATYVVFPTTFVRFGVLHFFATVLLIAPLFHALKRWAFLPGLLIVAFGVWMGRAGLFEVWWLYPTGLMSNRPSSVDYIPWVPWLGIFLIGMTAATYLPQQWASSHCSRWMHPIVVLGRHSLSFYFAHQIVIFAVLTGIAHIIR